MSNTYRRIFLKEQSFADPGRIVITGSDAVRLAALDVQVGSNIVALDGGGWEYPARIEMVSPRRCIAVMVSRRLASERRTKISVYQGMLHPSDYRRLLTEGTALGVVAFTPIIAEGSVVPMLDSTGRPEGESEFPRLVRETAEACGRGVLPQVLSPLLLDPALDLALQSATPLMIDPKGIPLSEALSSRPFSIGLFMPPDRSFSENERKQALARGATLVRPVDRSPDPTRRAVATLEEIYRVLD